MRGPSESSKQEYYRVVLLLGSMSGPSLVRQHLFVYVRDQKKDADGVRRIGTKGDPAPGNQEKSSQAQVLDLGTSTMPLTRRCYRVTRFG